MKHGFFAAYRALVRLFAGSRIGEWPPIAVAHRFLMTRLRPEQIIVDGHRFLVDPADSLGLSLWRDYEGLVTRVIAEKIRPGDTVLDIGANIGYYTLLLARSVGPRGMVYAFEPDPANMSLLRQNVTRNGYENVVLVEKAVTDRDQTLRLYRAVENSGDHQTYASAANAARTSIEVEAVALDSFFETTPTVALIKMDIQGAESGAVRGMKTLLQANPAVTVVTEVWPWGLANAGSSAAEFLGLLSDLGFSFLDLDERQGRPVPVPAAEVLAALGEARSRHTNLLCLRWPD